MGDEFWLAIAIALSPLLVALAIKLILQLCRHVVGKEKIVDTWAGKPVPAIISNRRYSSSHYGYGKWGL